MKPEQKIESALEMIMQNGGTDGAHHKDWVLDQVVRILADDYDEWVRQAKDGEDGADTYGYEVGIAP